MKWSGDAIMHSAFVNVCRLCMAEGTECMQPIFTESEHDGEKFILSMRINAVTFLKVRQGDQLPEQACQDCIAQVNRWYDFKTLCDGSDKLLRQRLKQLEGVPDMVTFQVKEELPEQAAAAVVCPQPPPAHNALLLPANNESVSYSLVQADSGLGRISNTFSLRQDVTGVAHGLLFNGDTSSLQQSDSLPNGVSSPYPFVCALCDTRFPRKAQLKRHIAAHCGEPPHTCSRCDAGFSKKSDLAKHMRTHFPLLPTRNVLRPPARRYTCPQCHWCFRHPLALLHHQTTHTGPSRQKCVFCRRVCTSAIQLQFHVRLEHMRSQRRRHCPHCQLTFISIAALSRHHCSNRATGRATIHSTGRATITAPSRVPVSAPSRATISVPSRVPVSAPSRATISTPSRVTLSALSRAAITAPSKATLSVLSRAAVSAPSRATVSVLSRATVSEPNKATVSEPNKATVSAPSRASVSAPSRATVSVLSRAIVSASSGVTVSAPSRATISAPSRATISALSGATISAVRGATISTFSRATVNSLSGATASAPSRATVSALSGAAVSAPSGAAISAHSGATVSVPNRVTISAPNRVTVSAPSRITMSPPSRAIISASCSTTDGTIDSATSSAIAEPCDPNNKPISEESMSTEQSATCEIPSSSEKKFSTKCDYTNNTENNSKINTETCAGNAVANSSVHSSDHSSYTSHSGNQHFGDVSDNNRTESPPSQPVDNVADNSNDQFASNSNDSVASHSNDSSTDQSTGHTNQHFSYHVSENLSDDLLEQDNEGNLGPMHIPASEHLPVLSE